MATGSSRVRRRDTTGRDDGALVRNWLAGPTRAAFVIVTKGGRDRRGRGLSLESHC